MSDYQKAPGRLMNMIRAQPAAAGGGVAEFAARIADFGLVKAVARLVLQRGQALSKNSGRRPCRLISREEITRPSSTSPSGYDGRRRAGDSAAAGGSEQHQRDVHPPLVREG